MAIKLSIQQWHTTPERFKAQVRFILSPHNPSLPNGSGSRLGNPSLLIHV